MPVTEKNKIIGIKKVLGTAKILAIYGINGRLRISKTTIPMYIDIITDQNISGLVSYNLGPGCIPKPNKAPNITAVVPLPGIPKVNKGTKAPEHAALLAVSGAHNP
jgi:hypothetical protein